MKIDEIVAVSGIQGLHKMVANRANGLVVEDLSTGKVRFASSRKHQFTPLASIAIFVNTEDESVELAKVFKQMYDNLESDPPLNPNAANDELMDYLETILPDYDRDQVYPSDVKKLIKWFNFLHEKSIIDFNEPLETAPSSEEEE